MWKNNVEWWVNGVVGIILGLFVWAVTGGVPFVADWVQATWSLVLSLVPLFFTLIAAWLIRREHNVAG